MTDSTVLLAMDFQAGIVERGGSAEVVTQAARAVAAARRVHVPVIFVRVAFRTGCPEVAERNLGFGRLRGSGGMGESDTATQIVPALAPLPDEPVVTKRRVSAFAGSDLAELLRGYDAKTLVLCGISTSGVVLSTVRQAADLDYRLTVLSDACVDPDPEVGAVLMSKVLPKQATVLTTGEWLDNLPLGAG